jgi:DNA-binding PucR family transcriptional regulator
LFEEGDSLAVGSMIHKLEELRSSYNQACETKETGSILWKNDHLYFYSLACIYSALKKRPFSYLDLLEIHELISKQKQLSFNSIETLETYIEAGNYKQAAKKLYIHENTLRYRIQKIADLFLFDLENPIVQQILIMKIKLWRLENIRDAVNTL